MKNRIYSSPQTTKTSSFWNQIKVPLAVSGTLTAMGAGLALLNAHIRKSRLKRIDEQRARSAERLRSMQDNYLEGTQAKTDASTSKRYFHELSEVFGDIMLSCLGKLSYGSDGEDRRNIGHRDYTDKKAVGTPMHTFLQFLSSILIHDICVITGSGTLIDRRNLELVYAPGYTNVDDVVRDPHRIILFKAKWPSHNFEVSDGIGATDFNNIVNNTIRYLSQHPQYLTVRLK